MTTFTVMKRRAVSPVMATLLLIAVAIAGALIAWQQMREQALTAGKSTKYEVVEVSLTKLQTGNQAYFAVTLKNTGTTAMTYTEAGFFDNNNTYHSFTDSSTEVKPGQQWSRDGTFGAQISVNQKYTVKIVGRTSEGSTFNLAQTVTAAG